MAYEIDDEELNGDAVVLELQTSCVSNTETDPDSAALEDRSLHPDEAFSTFTHMGCHMAELCKPPPGECDPRLQEKVANFIRIQRDKGRQVKSELRASRQYRNPDFLLKMVEAVGIQEAASNFPAEVFDPSSLHKEDFYEALKSQWAQQQQEIAELAQKRRATRQIEFTSGGVNHKSSVSGKSREVRDAVQRARAIAAKQNRKWDSRVSGR